jgi:UDP:flavonoid glycosyltransferase YjiC (YdhE family)
VRFQFQFIKYGGNVSKFKTENPQINQVQVHYTYTYTTLSPSLPSILTTILEFFTDDIVKRQVWLAGFTYRKGFYGYYSAITVAPES